MRLLRHGCMLPLRENIGHKIQVQIRGSVVVVPHNSNTWYDFDLQSSKGLSF